MRNWGRLANIKGLRAAAAAAAASGERAPTSLPLHQALLLLLLLLLRPPLQRPLLVLLLLPPEALLPVAVARVVPDPEEAMGVCVSVGACSRTRTRVWCNHACICAARCMCGDGGPWTGWL